MKTIGDNLVKDAKIRSFYKGPLFKDILEEKRWRESMSINKFRSLMIICLYLGTMLLLLLFKYYRI